MEKFFYLIYLESTFRIPSRAKIKQIYESQINKSNNLQFLKTDIIFYEKPFDYQPSNL